MRFFNFMRGKSDPLKDLRTIDYIGQALELESCANKSESQTAERAMLAAARTLRKVSAYFSA